MPATDPARAASSEPLIAHSMLRGNPQPIGESSLMLPWVVLPTVGAQPLRRASAMPATRERQGINGTTRTSGEDHSPPPKVRHQRGSDNGGYWAALALVLGLLVPVLGFVAVWMGFSAHDARNDANRAAAPFIHVRQGQKVELTLTNKGVIPHSVDFHAARIAPNVAFKDVQPGGSIHYSFVANDAGAFMFHCGTKPVLAHIANGMYGAIIVEPRKPLPPADKNYVLVAS